MINNLDALLDYAEEHKESAERFLIFMRQVQQDPRILAEFIRCSFCGKTGGTTLTLSDNNTLVPGCDRCVKQRDIEAMLKTRVEEADDIKEIKEITFEV